MSFAHIRGSLTCPNLFFGPLLLSLYSFYPSFVPQFPIVCIFQTPNSNYDRIGCQELTIPTDREGIIQPSGSVVNMRSQWSPTALALPMTRYDCRERSYALSGLSYVTTVATGCGTSLVSRPRRLNLLRCAAFEEQWLLRPHDRVFGNREN